MTGTAFWSGGRAKLDSVLMLEVDMLRSGEAGRAAVNGDGEGFESGGGAGVVFDADGCRGSDGTAGAAGGIGAVDEVGVG